MSYNHGEQLTTTFERLDGKVILITGASSGIGAAAARLFAREGAKVGCLARRKERLDDLVRELEGEGLNAIALPCDVTDESGVEAAVRRLVETYGRLDGAFNNAGHGAKPGRVHEMNLEYVDRILDTNYRGVLICMKHEAVAMLELGIRGSIVNTGSIAAMVGTIANSAYASTKWALLGLTKCAALDYALDGIRVNAIAPRGTRTEMFDLSHPTEEDRVLLAAASPMNHIAHADDIARSALFLLSEDSRWTTGTILPCEGGMSAGLPLDMRVLVRDPDS